MRKRLPLFMLLASGLTFLASLYLRWVESSTPAPTASSSPTGLLNLFSGSISVDGWGAYGQAAALLALALVAAAGVSLLRPQVAMRLPFASCGLALLYLALLNAAELHGTGVFQGALDDIGVHLGAGAYLGLASAAVAFLASVAACWGVLSRRPSVTAIVAFAVTLGLLAAFILPWLHVHARRVGRGAATGLQLSDVGFTVVIFIALLACLGLAFWRSRTPPGRRLVATLGLAVLVAGNLSTLGTNVHWPYEAWLSLGCSLGLVALALATGRGLRTSPPPIADVAAVVAASMLVASMFLPWLNVCGDGGSACLSESGWSLTNGPTAGGLAVILIVLVLGFQRLFVELAIGAAIYVMAAGFEVTRFSHLGYGAPFGFAGAALLLVVAARRLGSVPSHPRRLLVRLLPMVACLGFLAIPVATLTERLSQSLEVDSPWRLYWLEIGAVLVALRLLGRWLAGPRADSELVLLPLALLAITTLDLIVVRRAFGTISWEGWVSIGFCLLLAVLGWMERNHGLERLRLPEVWRIDRLPG